jgi:glyoxylase-like metal-dependent hydrolase (beta-lactamase superfamily II)
VELAVIPNCAQLFARGMEPRSWCVDGCMATEKWHVGDTRITKVVETELWAPFDALGGMLPELVQAEVDAMPWLRPAYFGDGTMSIGTYSFVIETSDHKVVIDTGIGNHKPRTLPEFNMLDTAYLQNFRQVADPADIDVVINTHLHPDHVGWNTSLVDGHWVPTFGDATYHFVLPEYEHLSGHPNAGHDLLDGAAVLADSVTPIVDAGLACFVEPTAQITPEVSLIPSHGHTPGHVSVLVESEGRRAVITGDLMHSPCQLGHPDWVNRFDTDGDAAAASRRAFLERFADSQTIVIGTHFGTPTGGLVHRDGAAFRLQVVD